MNTFLTAEWRYLVMANYLIDPAILAPRVPRGTELDDWEGHTYASLVAFRFLDTRLKGIPIPFHRDFDEINLRFYVRRRNNDGWKRGVVFVKEIVPRPAIAWVARALYNEPYAALPTRHEISTGDPTSARYEWKHRGEWHHIAASAEGPPTQPPEGSQANFITEHYWGYTPQRNGSTLEYEVQHPSWRVWAARDASVLVDIASLYGDTFTEALTGAPASTFIAEGSEVAVSHGKPLPE